VKWNGIYRTSDLYVAAWLLTKRLELEGINRSNSRRYDFIFADRQDRPELVYSFLCGRAVTNLGDFYFSVEEDKAVTLFN